MKNNHRLFNEYTNISILAITVILFQKKKLWSLM